MTPAEYEAKRTTRYARLLAASERAAQEAEALTAQARQMSSIIPLGQPILIGHHSERRDRAYRGRIESKYRRGYDLHQKAEALRGRAVAMRQNTAIFSDDPQASEKISDKVAQLEERQARMRQANALLRKGDDAGLLAMGFTEGGIASLKRPDFCGRTGFADYQLTNNNANIRRLRQRLTTLEAHAQDETSESIIGETRIIDNVEANRVQILFPAKPSPETRTALKAHGFRWAPSEGAWQRQRSPQAMYYAEQITQKEKP